MLQHRRGFLFCETVQICPVFVSASRLSSNTYFTPHKIQNEPEVLQTFWEMVGGRHLSIFSSYKESKKDLLQHVAAKRAQNLAAVEAAEIVGDCSRKRMDATTFTPAATTLAPFMEHAVRCTPTSPVLTPSLPDVIVSTQTPSGDASSREDALGGAQTLFADASFTQEATSLAPVATVPAATSSATTAPAAITPALSTTVIFTPTPSAQHTDLPVPATQETNRFVTPAPSFLLVGIQQQCSLSPFQDPLVQEAARPASPSRTSSTAQEAEVDSSLNRNHLDPLQAILPQEAFVRFKKAHPDWEGTHKCFVAKIVAVNNRAQKQGVGLHPLSYNGCRLRPGHVICSVCPYGSKTVAYRVNTGAWSHVEGGCEDFDPLIAETETIENEPPENRPLSRKEWEEVVPSWLLPLVVVHEVYALFSNPFEAVVTSTAQARLLAVYSEPQKLSSDQFRKCRSALKKQAAKKQQGAQPKGFNGCTLPEGSHTPEHSVFEFQGSAPLSHLRKRYRQPETPSETAKRMRTEMDASNAAREDDDGSNGAEDRHY
ncbi:hypothetical protein BC832DRAFT_539028 [Gaertneriomyces semiglobifer]|nr:hypothetical protein BC832DRAFT_539028 [Gaertneriomyces semiglobifer]